ncbi:hypothetical protein [Halotia branconii]|uniref:Uncharacterized protein n=1 Tax=Halotia branconii CENA392 TaxID=1539056 RepID=A0AAJ6NZ62_9CYAN|nr:hypothetical protein [Halotia branconii]WGV29103.1 hypothetical protein QI031_30325 [Halotia branconii CENA392]
MLDYVSASAAFFMAMFITQEQLVEERLGDWGRYWSVVITISLSITIFISGAITLALMINFIADPFKYPDNVFLCAIAAVIFAIVLIPSQWLILQQSKILRQSKITPRVFAVINCVVGIVIFALLVWLNEGTLEWSGNPIQGWKTFLIFIISGTITGAVTSKVLDFYCKRVEWRLFDEEQERQRLEKQRIERIENEVFEKRRQDREKAEREAQQRKEKAEAEALERIRIERELALEDERRWYEEHPEEAYGEWHDEDEDEE